MFNLRWFRHVVAGGLLIAFMVGGAAGRQQAMHNLATSVVEEEEATFDSPEDAWLYRQSQMVNENGEIPQGALLTAFAQADELRRQTALRAPNPAGSAASAWHWLGPGNVGGRIRAVAIHPTEVDRMWVGSVSGGLWYTSNGGASWAPVDDFMANLAITSIVFERGAPEIMYASTGESFYNSDGVRGAGVFKSTNGGVTWAQLSATNNANFNYTTRLAASPTAPQTLLATTDTGIWRTTDGGLTWNLTLAVTEQAKDVDFHPTDGNLAIASGAYGQAWYSTNSGASWIGATGLPPLSRVGRVEVAYAPSDPTLVYANVNRNMGEIWKSTNGGQSYTLINTGSNYLISQGGYNNALWVDPTNANILVVGGIVLWRSLDGGQTLTLISQSNFPVSAHPDHHIIVAQPGFDGNITRTVFFGNDGGLYKARDVYTVSAFDGWEELNNNLGITQFYGAAGNATTGVVVGGTQDNGTLRYSGDPENWTRMFGGDGGYSAADPTDAAYFYGEHIYLRIHRSTDGGLSSNYIFDGISDAGNCAEFISPLILDPNNPKRMLGGGCNLWRSENVTASAPTWVNIKAAIGSNITNIAVAPGNPDVVWVGHGNGNLYKTTNGTAATPTWTQLDTASVPNRKVTRLAVASRDSNTVYAAFGGFSTNNVWKTTDGGATWAAASGTAGSALPNAPVYALVLHPVTPTWVYVGTEVGIFVSEDGGGTWATTNSGPANVSVMDLFWLGNRLAAVTHGRGIYLSGGAPIITPTVGAGGSITPSTPQAVNYGSALTFNIMPNPGYRLADVGVDGVSQGLVPVFTFTNITTNHTISATFVPDVYTLTVAQAGQGSGVVTPPIGVYTYTPGTVVTLTATANSGSAFTGWSGDCSGMGSCVVTMTDHHNVTATFAVISHKIYGPWVTK